jgi:hypothetical protein
MCAVGSPFPKKAPEDIFTGPTWLNHSHTQKKGEWQGVFPLGISVVSMVLCGVPKGE